MSKHSLNNHENHTYILVMNQAQISPLNKLAIMAVFIALVTLFFTACAHSPEGCQELDWYELGRQDGAKGVTSNARREVEVVCTASDQSLAEAFYNNGFDSGAAQYCTRQNGFELGRKKAKWADICPPLLREEFTKGYGEGQRFTELQKLKTDLDGRIITLNLTLSDKSMAVAKRGLLNGEKIELEEKSRTVTSELEALESIEESLQQKN